MTFTPNRLTVDPFRRKLLFLLVAGLLVHHPASLYAQGKPHFTSRGKSITAAAFNREVEGLMREIGIPAVSLAVIDHNQVVFSRNYGHKQAAKKSKVNERTVFEACSLSKTFLAFVAHQLADEGKLDLDKPVYQYLEYQPLAHDARYQRITSRMILSHASGMENWKRFNNSDTLEILANPGEDYVYSGEGYNYLAEAIGKILSQPYEQYVDERVLKPLRLRQTYLKFETRKANLFHKEFPWNYAMGHNAFGQDVGKWRNTSPVPSSGQNLTAEDYAKLFVAFFNKTNFSDQRVKEILTPAVRIEEGASLYYGPGFELFHTNNDTIVAHGGSNTGFKSYVFYSVARKRGFVFLANSDRGLLMTRKLAEMTAGLQLDAYYKIKHAEQYPSPLVSLLNTYAEKGAPSMFAEVEKLQRAGQVHDNLLTALGIEFLMAGADPVIPEKLLEESAARQPRDPFASHMLGLLYLQMDRYALAHQQFTKVKALKTRTWEMDTELKTCAAKMRAKASDAQARSTQVARIDGKEDSLVEAENYTTMDGIRLHETSDAGGGKQVGYIDTDDWMDYQVNVAAPGTYSVSFRVVSPGGGGQLQIRSGTNVLAAVAIPATQSWTHFTTVSTTVDLPAGNQTLNLYVATGGFALDWIKFAAAADRAVTSGNKQ